MRKAKSRDRPRSEGERQLAYQRAVEEAFHPRSNEIREVRAPRYGTYVEHDRDKVRIHLLREWGEQRRRIDSVQVQEFAGTDVEASAVFLEELREEGLVREERDLNEWLRQRDAALEKKSATKSSRRTADVQGQVEKEIAAYEAELKHRQAAEEARIAEIEAEGLAEALRPSRRRRWR